MEMETKRKNGVNFQTHNDDVEMPTVGTSLQGYLTTTFKELKELLGKPTESDGYKIDAEWEILFEDGTVATIYNWKNGKNYNGRNGIPKTQITDWNIGGKNADAVAMVGKLFPHSARRY